MQHRSMLRALVASGASCHEELRTLEEQLAEVESLEDRPHLVDQLSWAMAEIRAGVEEGLRALEGAPAGGEAAVGRDAVVERLTVLQERLLDVLEKFHTQLAGVETLRHLVELPRERPQWQAWASLVLEQIERCRGPLQRWNRRLVETWSALANEGGAVRAYSTAIGHQITIATGRNPSFPPAASHTMAFEAVDTSAESGPCEKKVQYDWGAAIPHAHPA